jgi:hypothetical protein
MSGDDVDCMQVISLLLIYRRLLSVPAQSLEMGTSGRYLFKMEIHTMGTLKSDRRLAGYSKGQY